jgi:hypothetical protein
LLFDLVKFGAGNNQKVQQLNVVVICMFVSHIEKKNPKFFFCILTSQSTKLFLILFYIINPLRAELNPSMQR